MGEKLKATGEFLTEHILSVATEHGKEAVKKTVKGTIENASLEIVSTAGLDMLGSMLPGIGKAILAYRTERKIQNLKITVEEIAKQAVIINENLLGKSEENKRKIDQILELLFEKASTTNQDEKITYMVNGFVQITKSENINLDIAYLYYDTLDRLTLLDIAVLKLSYDVSMSYKNTETYVDVLEKFNIDRTQYQAIRSNLERIGLLENQYDDIAEKDLKELVETINDLYKSVKSMQDYIGNPKRKMKKLKNQSDLKLKAKDRLKISKFGRDFIDHFIHIEKPL